MSIKLRLVVAISLIVAVAFAVIGYTTVAVTKDRMIARVDQGLLAAPNVPPQSLTGEGPDGREYVSRRATAAIIFDGNGNVRFAEPAGYAYDPNPFPLLSIDDLRAHVGQIYTTGSEDESERHYRVLVRPLEDGFFVQAAPLDEVDATIQSLIAIISIVAVIVLAAVTAVVWLTIRRGLYPIDDMIGTAELIAGGELSHRIEHTDSATEVGRLGQALNAMLAQIEASFAAKEASEQRLRQFVADASHELRTPLTSIRGYAELLRSGMAPDRESRDRSTSRIESEATRMGRLVEDLLLLARLDQGRPLERQPLNLVGLVSEVVMDARVVDPSRSIGYEHPADAIVLGDPDRLRQVVVNLLTNARVHAGADADIQVMIAATGNRVDMTIADNGAGMAREDVARAFDRFYRVDVSRARSSGGSGLGLSIVKSIIEAHEGRVGIESSVGEGTSVTLSLPRYEDWREERGRTLKVPSQLSAD